MTGPPLPHPYRAATPSSGAPLWRARYGDPSGEGFQITLAEGGPWHVAHQALRVALRAAALPVDCLHCQALLDEATARCEHAEPDQPLTLQVSFHSYWIERVERPPSEATIATVLTITDAPHQKGIDFAPSDT